MGELKRFLPTAGRAPDRAVRGLLEPARAIFLQAPPDASGCLIPGLEPGIAAPKPSRRTPSKAVFDAWNHRIMMD
jgi:hypothetical protein